ncbi:carbonic anhydrase [Pilimelia terevasa]|uniref:carbonic anhydrase n=1 Tax=Pilimelia terevasa TaxID=53372 RepID=A0A8J3BQ64_9ACTN|nr:carbonic anhydrase [Pilimelia terevasa]GGK19862.1 carbonic anhydrase [Pilimelia terevasa]
MNDQHRGRPASPETPEAALAELIAGNARFVAGTREHPHQDAEHRAAIAGGQRPFAVLFGCSDSRLAAEIIFDRGLGDLFVVRTAGHVVGPEVQASIDYGVDVVGVPLVVVLGHDGCGAVQAAQTALADAREAPAALRPVVDRVLPSVRQARARNITDSAEVAALHVRRTVAMVAQSPTIAAAAREGRCAVVGMSYRLADGRVTVEAAAGS